MSEGLDANNMPPGTAAHGWLTIGGERVEEWALGVLEQGSGIRFAHKRWRLSTGAARTGVVEFLADGSGEIRFPVQKANREDVIPIDCELAAVLKQRHASMGSPSVGRVFPSTVMDRTRDRDFARAGIQKRDARGHVVDLHAFRMTLGTAFVRAGVPLVVAQRMLRHSDLKTTMSYYIDIGKKESREGLDQALKLL